MTQTVEIDFYHQKIRSMDCSPALVTPPDAPLHQVIARMREKRCGCAVVCDASGVLGTFTERTVLHRVLGGGVDLERPVSDLVRSVPTLALDDELETAIRHMDSQDVRHLPIVADGRGVVGVLSVRDVIDLLAQYYPQEVYNLPPRLRQRMEKPEGA